MESKLHSLEKACFVLPLCSFSCRKQGEPTEKVKAVILHPPLTTSSSMQFSNTASFYSLVPRLSPRANAKLKVTESWAGPGNKATHFTSHGKILY